MESVAGLLNDEDSKNGRKAPLSVGDILWAELGNICNYLLYKLNKHSNLYKALTLDERRHEKSAT